jgi:hypothetical protein
MFRVGTRESDLGWAKLWRLLDVLRRTGAHVKVGVLEGHGTGSELREGGLTNAQLAAVHEFGSADGKIPERSFIRSTFDANRETYRENLKELLVKVVDGKLTVEKAFSVLGLKIATDIKKRITTGAGIPPPNAPSTVARKIKKGAWNKGGGGAPRPLVDTGRLLGAITWAYFATRGER